MHVLALAVPIFFQTVIDRVLVYLSISTLVVIGVGVVAAILFDSCFNWLRGYFVLKTASRIDIRLAQTTFRHLMKLPISFFDQSRAGVVTKHMQQGSQIREFLTGRLLGTLLDLPALLVFLPLLLWYSVNADHGGAGGDGAAGPGHRAHAGTVSPPPAPPLCGRSAAPVAAGGKRARHAHHQVAEPGAAPRGGLGQCRRRRHQHLCPGRQDRPGRQYPVVLHRKGAQRHHRDRGRLPGVQRRSDGGRAGGLQHAVGARDLARAAADRPAEQLSGSADERGNAGRDHEPPRRKRRARPDAAAFPAPSSSTRSPSPIPAPKSRR